MANCCLYRITSPSGKLYFGITSAGVRNRWRGHLHHAKIGKDTPLHRAISKYGASNMVLEILAVGQRDYIRDLERSAVEHFQTQNRSFGYNVLNGGDNGAEGRILTQEQRDAIRQKNLGRKHSPEARLRMSEAAKGRYRSPEHCAKISESKKNKPGNKWSDDKREKMAKIIWPPVSDITRARMRNSALGRGLSSEAKKKVSASLQGNTRAKGKTWTWYKDESRHASEPN